jgi:hypothetical protein
LAEQVFSSAQEEHYAMRRIKKIGAALVASFVLSGCQALTGRTAGRNLDDLTITTSVKARLVADKISNLTRIDVDTVNAVVSLTGLVESEEEKRRAEDIASWGWYNESLGAELVPR